jgi:spore coat protein U-like protein
MDTKREGALVVSKPGRLNFCLQEHQMIRKLGIAAGLAVLVGGAAHAATATANLGVQITITAACTLTGGTLNFGNQGILAANIDQSATMGVTCTNTTPYTVGLDKGANGASVTTRKMKGGATNTEFVNYSLFSDAGRVTNWGTTIGTDTVAGTGNGSAQTISVYGRVPAQATGSPGAYTDTVTITVTY